MRRQLLPALLALAVFTVLCGIAYPLAVTAVAQVAFGHRADGSLIERGGVVVGSELLGQNFADPRYLWPRPSAAGAAGYDGAASGGSNAGPTNDSYLATVSERVDAYRQANGLGADQPVPVDAVTASGSGLDPEISLANARLQAPRIAQARGLPLDAVLNVLDEHTGSPTLGFLGKAGVNVLQANLALDDVG